MERLLVGAEHPTPLPHLADLLVAVAIRLKRRKPACILLPSTEDLAELTAVLLAMRNMADDATDLTRQARLPRRVRSGPRAQPDLPAAVSVKLRLVKGGRT